MIKIDKGIGIFTVIKKFNLKYDLFQQQKKNVNEILCGSMLCFNFRLMVV